LLGNQLFHKQRMIHGKLIEDYCLSKKLTSSEQIRSDLTPYNGNQVIEQMVSPCKYDITSNSNHKISITYCSFLQAISRKLSKVTINNSLVLKAYLVHVQPLRTKPGSIYVIIPSVLPKWYNQKHVKRYSRKENSVSLLHFFHKRDLVLQRALE
jgi:hypothetical protein